MGKWELKPQYQDSLNGLIKTLELNPKITIELSSHTDSRPIPMTNIELSKRRAQSVIDYLISKGIAADRLKAKGAGETEPKVLKSDVVKDGFKFKKGTVLTDEFINSLKSKDEKEAAHALNRRTEFRVLSKNYVPTKNSNVEAPKVELINVPTDNKTTDDVNKKDEETPNIEENKTDQNKGQTDNKTNAPVKKDTKNKKTN